MRNIFFLYMPPNNAEAMAHYRDTIEHRVSFDRIVKHVSEDAAARLQHIFGARPIAVWGSRDTQGNRTKFAKMQEGDDLLIIEGANVRFIGKVALKVVSQALSRELWDNLNPQNRVGWDLIYFIANPVEVDLPFDSVCQILGYQDNYQLRGFTIVSAERATRFFERYEDLYSVLIKLRVGERILERDPAVTQVLLTEASVPPILHEPISSETTVSEHVKMQWKLARLGRKAGEKVWVPSADQMRLRNAYNFTDFELEFAAGIDLPKGYFENIDVVWKEEFRIDAAFEVEHSTAIYSGLLRFADLNAVAPNTAYPMFIVAPADRRNQVRDQVRRPAFGRLNLRDKVKFLPYETVDEIERFIGDAPSGLSVELITGKAESFA